MTNENVDVDVEALDMDENVGEEEFVDIEGPFATKKQELRELRARLISTRKTLKNADKKQKKSIQEELSRLEEQIKNVKQALDAEEKLATDTASVLERTQEAERVAAARAKRQAKKELKSEEDERKRQEAQAIAAKMPQLGRLEREAFETVLGAENLEIFEIEPDGSCLFNAISHQLKTRLAREYDQSELRRMAAEFISAQHDKYAGFLEEPLAEYCERLVGNDLWGGHLELDALCECLGVPIIVYQANSPPMTFGPELTATPLRLWYDYTKQVF